MVAPPVGAPTIVPRVATGPCRRRTTPRGAVPSAPPAGPRLQAAYPVRPRGDSASPLDGRAEAARRSPGSEIPGPGTHRVGAPTNAPDGEPPHPSSAGLGGGAEGIVALSDGE